ncbi:hypothetical protein CAP31_10860 [Sulfuriferula sp. AH1]|uniref:DUF3025 domain-containing protein n=1 Tax=Sulfuriferula sp. AH1 TaxID=1985873 RepID=UPI000B3B50BE|nr:DUF3025 domain-containing protein [Sulfuriferula sp. AH1]ARU32134.1 hypothetical protein CAP31_10860 [Sulfuriferula sp. AH1]
MSWQPDWLQRSPLFAPLMALPQALTRDDDWIDLDLLNQYATAHNITNASGQTIQFTASDTGQAYETRIAETSQVPTRVNNWHDYFNALAWLIWPHSKAALNQLHIAAGITAQRDRRRDALTLLDESGVIVACADPALWQLLQQHQWSELFVGQRERIEKEMAFHLIGHALYEKALQPYPAMTGKCQVIMVQAEFFTLEPAQRQQQLDRLLAQQLLQHPPLTPGEFAALPVLGIPGVTAENSDPSYYQNTRVFRP